MRKSSISLVVSLVALVSGGCSNEDARTNDEGATEKQPAQVESVSGFQGKIGQTFAESVEDWPKEPLFTGQEPNVLLILLDDVGYAQIGSFGGLTETPNMDKLAADGLRYNNFHTTALCSPSRAAILAGRNHHSIGLGSHAMTAMGFPGYAGRVPMTAQEVTKTAQHGGWAIETK